MEHKWKPKIENNKKLTLDDAKFYFDQAEKFLLDVTDAHKTILERSYTLLTLKITLLTALAGLGIDRIQKIGWKDNFSISLWVLILYLFCAVIYLLMNIKPIRYMGIGSQPKSIFIDRFFIPQIDDKERIVRLYVSEIERYQHRIEENVKINTGRWNNYKKTILLLLGIPIVFLLSYFFLVLIKCT